MRPGSSAEARARTRRDSAILDDRLGDPVRLRLEKRAYRHRLVHTLVLWPSMSGQTVMAFIKDPCLRRIPA